MVDGFLVVATMVMPLVCPEDTLSIPGVDGP